VHVTLFVRICVAVQIDFPLRQPTDKNLGEYQMKLRFLLSVITIALAVTISTTAEAGMFGRFAHYRGCVPCAEVQACEPCVEVAPVVCEPICAPCEAACGDCQPVRPFRPISRFFAALKSRLASHRDCDPCGEVVAVEPCEPICEPCQPICEPCEPYAAPRIGFLTRLKLRLAARCASSCEPCQPVCETTPVCEPCKPVVPCVPQGHGLHAPHSH
jgi:hypothetical protein